MKHGHDFNNHKQDQEDGEEEAALRVLTACGANILQYVINAAIELDLFEIIAKAAGGASPSGIARQIQASNPEAARVLDSMLCLLVAHSFLTCSNIRLENGVTERRYRLAPAGRLYVSDESGASLAPYHALCCQDPEWLGIKDLVLHEGGTLVERLHGKTFYEQITQSDPKSLKVFDGAMGAHSTVTMKRALQIYDGFNGLCSIVNIGGGNGVTLRMIISKHPSIHGINFDLPEVIKASPAHDGIEHISGDMFVEVPKGDAILLKFILHNWNDDQCLKILENCYKALGDKGKVIVMDAIFPQDPGSDLYSKFVAQLDFIMSAKFGGKERTQAEFEALATRAGFGGFKVMCCAFGTWIMELAK